MDAPAGSELECRRGSTADGSLTNRITGSAHSGVDPWLAPRSVCSRWRLWLMRSSSPPNRPVMEEQEDWALEAREAPGPVPVTMSCEARLPAEPRAAQLEPNRRVAGLTVHHRAPGPVCAGSGAKAGRDQLPSMRCPAFGPNDPAGLPAPWAGNLHRVTLAAPHGRFLRSCLVVVSDNGSQRGNVPEARRVPEAAAKAIPSCPFPASGH